MSWSTIFNWIGLTFSGIIDTMLKKDFNILDRFSVLNGCLNRSTPHNISPITIIEHMRNDIEGLMFVFQCFITYYNVLTM